MLPVDERIRLIFGYSACLLIEYDECVFYRNMALMQHIDFSFNPIQTFSARVKMKTTGWVNMLFPFSNWIVHRPWAAENVRVIMILRIIINKGFGRNEIFIQNDHLQAIFWKITIIMIKCFKRIVIEIDTQQDEYGKCGEQRSTLMSKP